MAVLVEALSVITRRDRIDSIYPGGVEGFLRDAPNRTGCADNHLVRVGFMSPEHAQRFIQELEHSGLVYRDPQGRAQDIVIVDQIKGPATPCDWADVVTVRLQGNPFTACRMIGTNDRTLSCPGGWTPEQAMNHSLVFVPNEEMHERMEFLREENGLLVCRDRVTGKIMYSPSSRTDDPAREHTMAELDRHDPEKWSVIHRLMAWLFPRD